MTTIDLDGLKDILEEVNELRNRYILHEEDKKIIKS
jgi:hypothetical protein